VEVLNDDDDDDDDAESINDFLIRVKTLEGKTINLTNPANYGISGKAIVLKLGTLDGYDEPAKITIAYFDDGKTEDAYVCMMKYIYNFAQV